MTEQPTPTPPEPRDPQASVLETAIAEADPVAGRLRYRGVDLADLVGRVPFERVWGLLVDDAFEPGLPPAEPFPLPVHTGDVRVDVQSALAQLAPIWGFRPLLDIEPDEARHDLARAAVMALSFVGQSARGRNRPMVTQKEVDRAATIAERFMIRWRGEPNPRHVEAVDAFWVATAEHGFNPATLTARVIASTGADVAACLSGAVGAMSGPLAGGAPARVLQLLHGVEQDGDADRYVARLLDRREWPMGFGTVGYRVADPRADLLEQVCRRLGAPRVEVAEVVERAVRAQLGERHPARVVNANVTFWGTVLLDYAEVPPSLLATMFICARTAGWSAHILEQKRTGLPFRPTTRYAGHPPRALHEVAGWAS